MLLLKRREDRGGFWQIVTGRVEPGEAPRAAAAREILREETGQALEVQALGYENAFAFGDRVPPFVAKETAFAARWEGGDVTLCDEEHDAYRWASPEEALAALRFAGSSRPCAGRWRAPSSRSKG